MSAAMGDFKKDPTLEIVCEDGRPSYFQEKKCELHNTTHSEHSAAIHQVSKRLNGHSAGLGFNTEAAIEKPVEIVEEKLQHQP